MARYNADIFPLGVDLTTAVSRLEAMDDQELILRLHQGNFPEHPNLRPVAFNRNEPEHESLAMWLRQQAQADLNFAYSGHDDYRGNDWLARAPYGVPGRPDTPYPVVILLWDNEEDLNHDDYLAKESGNPVARLRALGICDAPPAPAVPRVTPSRNRQIRAETIITNEEIDRVRRDMANLYVREPAPYRPVATTNSIWADNLNLTVTRGGIGYQTLNDDLLPSEVAAVAEYTYDDDEPDDDD